MLKCENCGAGIPLYSKFCTQCGHAVTIPSIEAQSVKMIEAQPVERRDKLFVLLSFVIGFLFCEFILFGGLALSVPVFVVLFYIAAGAYLGKTRNLLSRPSLLTLLPVALILCCFVLFDNTTLRAFNVLALWMFICLNLNTVMGASPVFWAGSLADICKVTFVMPFHHFGRGGVALSSLGKKGGGRSAVKILLTLLVISPLVWIVLALLAGSDAGFEKMLNQAANMMTDDIWEYAAKTILAVLLMFPIFSLLFSLRNDQRPQKHLGFMLRLGAFDTLVTVTTIAVFSLIYLLYISVQADYFFSALRGVLPAAFTYAEYARRGFFELVGVVFFNFCLIAGAITFTKRKDGRPTRGCRTAALIFAALTLLLIVTAASKMVIYVGSYGLTPLRVYTSFFMLILGLVTFFVMIKLVFPTFRFYTVAAVTAIALYVALNFANVDRSIAGYNIRLYTQGVTKELDTSLFYELSDSAIPQIVTLRDDQKYGSDIKRFLSDRRAQIENTSWQNQSVAKRIALEAIEQQ